MSIPGNISSSSSSGPGFSPMGWNPETSTVEEYLYQKIHEKIPTLIQKVNEKIEVFRKQNREDWVSDYTQIKARFESLKNSEESSKSGKKIGSISNNVGIDPRDIKEYIDPLDNHLKKGDIENGYKDLSRINAEWKGAYGFDRLEALRIKELARIKLARYEIENNSEKKVPSLISDEIEVAREAAAEKSKDLVNTVNKVVERIHKKIDAGDLPRHDFEYLSKNM